MQKTYKREIAGAMLVAVFGFGVAGIWYTEAQNVMEHLSVPVFMFAGVAFGMDSYAKQVK